MGSQIDKLLEKYWNGETSLEEEQIIKSHFKSAPSLTGDGTYFRYLSNQKEVTFEQPQSIMKSKKTWLSAAATVTIGLITAVLVLNDAQKDPFAIDDPEVAFQATKNALMMIGSNINEGQKHTLELTKINKAQEELQEDSVNQ